MHTESGHNHKPMQRIIEVCLLVMLSGPDCEHCHGYALGERLREFGFSDSEISVSTLYRTLRGMEEAGWVTSGWAAGGPGPQRREYAVTDAGRSALDVWAAVLQKRRERISRVLDAYMLLGREPAAEVTEDEIAARGLNIGTARGGRHRHGAKQTAQEPVPTADMQPESETTAVSQSKEAENLHEYWD